MLLTFCLFLLSIPFFNSFVYQLLPSYGQCVLVVHEKCREQPSEFCVSIPYVMLLTFCFLLSIICFVCLSIASLQWTMCPCCPWKVSWATIRIVLVFRTQQFPSHIMRMIRFLPWLLLGIRSQHYLKNQIQIKSNTT